MDKAQEYYWKSVEAWIRESHWVVNYNAEEIAHLESQLLNIRRRIELLNENNENILKAIEIKQAALDEHFRQQTETNDTHLPKGENLQDGSGENEVEKRSGKGEDNKGGECL